VAARGTARAVRRRAVGRGGDLRRTFEHHLPAPAARRHGDPAPAATRARAAASARHGTRIPGAFGALRDTGAGAEATGAVHRSGRPWRHVLRDERRAGLGAADAVGLGDYGRRSGYCVRQIRTWGAQWERSRTRDLPDMEVLLTRLAEVAPADSGSVIVHGDFR